MRRIGMITPSSNSVLEPTTIAAASGALSALIDPVRSHREDSIKAIYLETESTRALRLGTS
jgi:hypothetical protein